MAILTCDNSKGTATLESVQDGVMMVQWRRYDLAV